MYSLTLTHSHSSRSYIDTYRQVSNISHTKSQHLKDSRIVLRLSLPNPLKPDVNSRMKMQLEQRRQAMLQLHQSDRQFYCLLGCVLYWRLYGIVWAIVCTTAPPVRSLAKLSAIFDESVTAVTVSRFSPWIQDMAHCVQELFREWILKQIGAFWYIEAWWNVAIFPFFSVVVCSGGCTIIVSCIKYIYIYQGSWVFVSIITVLSMICANTWID